MASEAEVAWAAGVIEGEGSIFLRLSGRGVGSTRNVPSVKVSMTDEDVVRRVAAIAGFGSVSTTVNKSGSLMYQWQCSRRDVVPPFLILIRPWMGARRTAQIDGVLAGAASYGWDGTNRSLATAYRCVVHG